jgi:hypothetical protein
MYANPPPGFPAGVRAYARRLVTMLHAHQPDLDPAVDCRAAPATPRSPRKLDTPPAQPDELPIDNGMEIVVGRMHDMLHDNQMDRAAARAMHCDFDRVDREQIAERGSVSRQLRGMHRRVRILLEAYHPGVTAAACK